MKSKKFSVCLLIGMSVFSAAAFPVASSDRLQKALNYYDYAHVSDAFDYASADIYEDVDDGHDDADPVDAADAADDAANYAALNYNANDIAARTLSKRKKLRRPSYNSPIYYIRLPPQPYMFVPGFGYVSQPPAANPAVQQFLNVPVSFVANGKPANIYQWSGLQPLGDALPVVPPPPSPSLPPPRPQPSAVPPKPESTIHRLPGQFAFNGKPKDIFVLRDSYNSLYSDALQNFYP